MDIFISNISSVSLLRCARTSRALRLEECLDRTVTSDIPPYKHWWHQEMEDLRQLLAIDMRHPLHIHVPCERQRVRSQLVESDILSTVLPRHSFLLAVMTSDGTSVRIDSGALSLVQFAHDLQQAERQGRLDRRQSRAMLIDFGMELCGSYSRCDGESTCHFFLPPLTTADELQRWSAEARGLRGLTLARYGSRCIMNGSASPMETLHAIMLSSPPELGGLGLGEPLLNMPLCLDDTDRGLMSRRSMRPDLFFPDLGIAIEHQGRSHRSAAQYMEDASRSQMYAALGISVLATSAQDVRGPEAYERFLRRLVRCIIRRGRPRLGHQLTDVLDNPTLCGTRESVLSALTDRPLQPWQH